MFAEGGIRNQNINLIDGGTGIFANATGLMLGLTQLAQIPGEEPGNEQGNAAALKFMTGYIDLDTTE